MLTLLQRSIVREAVELCQLGQTNAIQLRHCAQRFTLRGGMIEIRTHIARLLTLHKDTLALNKCRTGSYIVEFKDLLGRKIERTRNRLITIASLRLDIANASDIKEANLVLLKIVAPLWLFRATV